MVWHSGKEKPDWKLPARILSNGKSVLQDNMACFIKTGAAGRLTIRAQRNHMKTFERKWGTKGWSSEEDREEEK